MVFLKGLAVWFVIIFAETLHGIARTILLEPYVGDFRARQIAVFTGSAIIFFVTCLFIRWLEARNLASLLAIGFCWLGLTLAFEILLGRVVFSLSWERIASDYNLFKGGLLPIGLLILTLSPVLAAKLRKVI